MRRKCPLKLSKARTGPKLRPSESAEGSEEALFYCFVLPKMTS
jgi:hypothetical protein